MKITGKPELLGKITLPMRWTNYISLKCDGDKPINPLYQIALEGHKLLYKLEKDGMIKNIHKEIAEMHFNVAEQMMNGEFKIFNIDDKLDLSLKHTKNKIYYRKSPFVRIFLETALLIEKSFNNLGWRRILGLSITDLGQSSSIKNTFINKEELVISGIIECENSSVPSSFLFIIPKDDQREPEKNDILDSKEKNDIREYVCNFLDFLNHPDVETRIAKWFNNDKRIQRGQLPIPDRVSINVKGKLYKYIYEISPNTSPRGKIDCRFWVRGHYIHFWNKKKYKGLYSLEETKLANKGYYLDKQGIVSKWILPYIKGQGELKNKQYYLKSSSSK